VKPWLAFVRLRSQRTRKQVLASIVPIFIVMIWHSSPVRQSPEAAIGIPRQQNECAETIAPFLEDSLIAIKTCPIALEVVRKHVLNFVGLPIGPTYILNKTIRFA
jgi:hypothetical protein